MKRTLLGISCAAVLAAALMPVSHASDRAPQRAEEREHDGDDRDDDDREGRPRRSEWRFKRVGTFANFRNAGLDRTTVSEIITATPDGKTLIYTDAEGAIGFIDITNPAEPVATGTVAVDPDPATPPAYSPTSVTVWQNRYVLVAVDASVSKKQPSGELQVIDLQTRARVATIDLGGQPDSVKVSPDHRYVAVVVENERDETLCVGGTVNDQSVSESACTAGGGRLGGMPQSQLGNPAGYLAVIETTGAPAAWTRSDVSLVGYAARFPNDPEPEFVDINRKNEAVVTLQENNHVVIVDLRHKSVVSHFTAGAVDLSQIDTVRAGSGVPNTIALVNTQAGRLREPDAVAWVGDRIATANEGDYDGGSRGFTIFDRDGSVFYDSGNQFEHLGVRFGHYPDRRSNAKGTEPEAILYAKYGRNDVLFVGSERGSFVAVYLVDRDGVPQFSQLLPGPLAPEGLLAVSNRNLFVASGENDTPPYGARSTVQIYKLDDDGPFYPSIYSANEEIGGAAPTPIPWGALSGLTEVPGQPGRLQAVSDSFYTPTSIFNIDTTVKPAVLTRALTVGTPCTTAAGCLDPEGLAYAPNGDLWIASEGNADDTRPNRLIQVDPATGAVLRTVGLPSAVLACRAAERAKTPASTRATGSHGSGFEGLDIVVNEGGGYLIVAAQQRGWNYATTPACDLLDDDPLDGGNIAEPGQTRLWVFDPSVADNDAAWSSVTYTFQEKPVDAAWIGLSEITYTPGGWMLIERDNLTGSFDSPDGAETPNGYKTLVRVPLEPGGDNAYTRDEKQIVDLRPALVATNGWITDKPEGVGVRPDGTVFVVTDNDGVDGSSGETIFTRLGKAWRLFR
ncbi:MAG: esterase-like activity of phytase family protein [Acidobacteria bacterium]|nr:esterase-like activity of phytase family protein [Acidobacteriota bacterium]